MSTYSNPSIDHIYELLFCDDVELYCRDNGGTEYPWSVLCARKPDAAQLGMIVDDPELEARQQILAANLLRSLGKTSDDKRLLGVIVEVGMEKGLDVLAAYEDGTARYINYSESMIVWDTRTQQSDELVIDLFHAARNVVEHIGPWDRERLARPVNGDVRLSFLVTDGLYFGEGQFEVLAQDPMGGPVIAAATKLMQLLVSLK